MRGTRRLRLAWYEEASHRLVRGGCARLVRVAHPASLGRVAMKRASRSERVGGAGQRGPPSFSLRGCALPGTSCSPSFARPRRHETSEQERASRRSGAGQGGPASDPVGGRGGEAPAFLFRWLPPALLEPGGHESSDRQRASSAARGKRRRGEGERRRGRTDAGHRCGSGSRTRQGGLALNPHSQIPIGLPSGFSSQANCAQIPANHAAGEGRRLGSAVNMSTSCVTKAFATSIPLPQTAVIGLLSSDPSTARGSLANAT